MDYWNAFYFKYRTIGISNTGKLRKLSDHRISNTKLKLADYQILDIKTTFDCPALINIPEPKSYER